MAEHRWAPRLEGTEGPIYLAIADAIGRAVAVGALRPGEQLPTHRALAEALSVDLTTVTRAYAEARRRGLLQATVGRGTFVRAAAPPPASQPAAGEVDLSMNLPPVPADLSLPDLLQRGLGRLLTTTPATALLTYRSGAGSREEIAAASSWLRPTLGAAEPERLLLSPGAQPALAAILAMLARPGDVVLTDRLTYPGIRGAAAHCGIRLLCVAGDEDGMLPDAIEAVCRSARPKALYCIPTMQNPTTVTMPVARRHAIVEVARRRGLRILEDDAYGRLSAHPLPALAALAPEISFHVATMSKVLSPALRIAFVAAPDGATAQRLSAALRRTVLMASPLLTGLLASWIEDGTAASILAAIRRESAARQALARELLPPGQFAAHPEGLHLWLRLPPHWDRRDFVAYLRRQDGLAVVPSDAFAVASDSAPPDAVRLALGAARDRDTLRGALHAVASALRQDRAAAFSEVV